jgi:hypothetical protein
MEFCVPNIMALGDIEDFITLIEPRALMISGTSNDLWSRGAQHMFDHARRHFKDGRLVLKLYEGPHVFTAAMREEAYLFLDQYLRTDQGTEDSSAFANSGDHQEFSDAEPVS